MDHLLHGKSNILSLQEWTFILVIDLFFLHVMLLLKLPSVYLKNALFTIMVFYAVLLLNKKLFDSYRSITVGHIWSFYVPHCLEVASLIQHCLLLKDTVIAPIR